MTLGVSGVTGKFYHRQILPRLLNEMRLFWFVLHTEGGEQQ